MKWAKFVWRDIMRYLRYGSYSDEDYRFDCEMRDLRRMIFKYERLQKFYPNILARLNTRLVEKEKKSHESCNNAPRHP